MHSCVQAAMGLLMADVRDFQQLQNAFAAHIRKPAEAPLPEGVEDRRMAIYRDLFFNNINGFLENGFPVLRSLYNEEDWLALVRSFFADHRCKTPYFAKISEEFLAFLQTTYQPTAIDPPFMLELAHYEWVELALMILDEAADASAIDRHGDLLREIPVLSPTAWLLGYQWPVQHISQDYQPDEPSAQPNHLIVYRDREDNVGFIEANPVTARLFQLLETNSDQSGQSLLETIAEEIRHPNPQIVIDGGHQTLTRLHNLDIVAGTRTNG